MKIIYKSKNKTSNYIYKKILSIFHLIKEPNTEPAEIIKNSNIYKLPKNNPTRIEINPKDKDKKIIITVSLYFPLRDKLNKS